jgi:hypothetical protein
MCVSYQLIAEDFRSRLSSQWTFRSMTPSKKEIGKYVASQYDGGHGNAQRFQCCGGAL